MRQENPNARTRPLVRLLAILLLLAPGAARGATGSLLASTFFGGAGDEQYVKSLCVAPGGDVYVAGQTSSADLPTTPGAYDSTYAGGGGDIFVARFSADFGALVACTYLGGSGLDGAYSGTVIGVDGDGNVLVAGHTESDDWPTTAGAFDTSPHGGADGFVVKLTPDLTALIASTYFGGDGREFVEDMEIDGDGRVWITGTTCSSGFPATAGSYDDSYNGGGAMWGDVYVARFENDLASLGAATFIGGSGGESGGGLELDGAGGVVVVGYSWSNDYPFTSGAYDTTAGAGADLVVSRLDTALTTLLASTYLGGSSDEYGLALGLGSDGSVYISGHTASADFPVSPAAYDTSYNSAFGAGIGDDVYVARLGPDLTTLLGATYFGGRRWDATNDLWVRPDGDVVIAGSHRSPDMPVTAGAFDDVYSGGLSDYGREGFVARISGDLTTLRVCTYLGETGDEWISASAEDGDGNIIVAGATNSADFPVTGGAYDVTYNGGTAGVEGGDVFVCRFDPSLLGAAVSVGASDAPPRKPSVTVAPNPFNPTATIRFVLDRPVPARVEVLDVRGRIVRVLADTSLAAGGHRFAWDGRCATGGAAPSGVYFARLVTPGASETKKMTLLR